MLNSLRSAEKYEYLCIGVPYLITAIGLIKDISPMILYSVKSTFQ